MNAQNSLVALVLAVFLAFGTGTLFAAPTGQHALSDSAYHVDVTALQARLTTLAFDPGPADGIFGQRTRGAVLAFQEEHALPPSGTADPLTLRALEREYGRKRGTLHEVVKGETLHTVARTHGIAPERLRSINLLRDPALTPGEVLRLPISAVARAAEPRAAGVADGSEGAGRQTAKIQAAGNQAAASLARSSTADLPGKAPHQQDGPLVLGYYAEDWEGDRASLNSLREADGLVDVVVNFQMAVDAAGNISTRTYPHLMAEARVRGARVQGLVHNFWGDWFDREVARAVLSDPAVRARAISNIMAAALEQGLSGVNVDIENVPPAQRQNYTAFVRELAAALEPSGLELAVSVPGKTWDDPTSSWEGAFDYRALGQYADWVVPMAYDEHTLGYSAGPVASYGWVDQVAAYAASQIPPEKVILGIAAYGYDWRRGSTQGRGLSAWGAAGLAERYGEPVQWDEEAKVPYFTYVRDGVERVVYYEDARSTNHKLNLVGRYGLGGIAIWKLGLEDAGIWPVIAESLPES